MDTLGRSESLAFFRLLSNDLRWQLVHRLAHSDGRLSDLAAHTGQPADDIAAELEPLRAAGLIRERPSDTHPHEQYYQLDLERLRAGWQAAGAALHPGLVAQTDIRSS
jgi:hypothetical protein